MKLEVQLVGNGVATIIVATDSSLSVAPIALPFIFDGNDLAQGFLSACERVGVSLYPDMGYFAMKELFGLWYDGLKRSV